METPGSLMNVMKTGQCNERGAQAMNIKRKQQVRIHLKKLVRLHPKQLQMSLVITFNENKQRHLSHF
jgi:hypothetical protein